MAGLLARSFSLSFSNSSHTPNILRHSIPFLNWSNKINTVQYYSIKNKKWTKISSQFQPQTVPDLIQSSSYPPPPPPPPFNSTEIKCQWLVIVESPAKAKSIQTYLGEEYEVIASYGHVRDLLSKSGSVQPENDFEIKWQMNAKADQIIKTFISSLKSKKGLILATDPDREGEAISWHVVQTLHERRSLSPNLIIQRVCFNEITKNAIVKAIQTPREISSSLVEAYLARRALDYLIGFHLSPILWRRLPGSKSAGRVQSVALKLICEREVEIEEFVPSEYWQVCALFSTKPGEVFDSELTILDGKRLDKLAIGNESTVKEIVDRVNRSDFVVRKVKESKVNRSPSPPFSTSTLQQEAFNRLGFSVSKTMTIAQQLYEGVNVNGQTIGVITYMRTDSIQLSADSIKKLRKVAQQNYGINFIPEKPRIYKTKIKNTQEAHEAIRPTDPSIHPSRLVNFLEIDALKLYALIWYRSISSQMSNAIFNQVAVDITNETNDLCFHATGSKIQFEGFLAPKKDVSYYLSYSNSSNGEERDDNEFKYLPILNINQKLDKKSINPSQHFTSSTPRYTEGSLVKQMEEIGIGRPSTYASIIKTLQFRKYINIESRRIFPEIRGRLVVLFLEKYFPRYMDYYFTAKVETQLDEISSGEMRWKNVLDDFWKDFIQNLDQASKVDASEISTFYQEEFGKKLIFPKLLNQNSNEEDWNLCPVCKKGNLEFKLSSRGTGLFLGCNNYPDCKHILNVDSKLEIVEKRERSLGIDEATGNEVFIKEGPYGPYIEILDKNSKKKKPMRATLPQDWNFDDIEIEDAIKLFNPAKIVGVHPEGGNIEIIPFGRFGPYLIHNQLRASVPKKICVDDVDLNAAIEILEKKKNKFKAKNEKIKMKPNAVETKAKKSKEKIIENENEEGDLNTLRVEENEGEEGEGEGKREESTQGKEKMVKRGRKTRMKKEGKVLNDGEEEGGEEKGKEVREREVEEEEEEEEKANEEIITKKKTNRKYSNSNSKPIVVEKPSPELAIFLGSNADISKKEVYSIIWNYIKEKELQNPSDKRRAILDDKLETLLGVKEVTTLNLHTYIKKQFCT